MLWGVTIGYDYHGDNLVRAMGSKIAIGFKDSHKLWIDIYYSYIKKSY